MLLLLTVPLRLHQAPSFSLCGRSLYQHHPALRWRACCSHVLSGRQTSAGQMWREQIKVTQLSRALSCRLALCVLISLSCSTSHLTTIKRKTNYPSPQLGVSSCSFVKKDEFYFCSFGRRKRRYCAY